MKEYCNYKEQFIQFLFTFYTFIEAQQHFCRILWNICCNKNTVFTESVILARFTIFENWEEGFFIMKI